jgi:hypothetical protein
MGGIGASFFVLIYPYIEQQALYELVVNRSGTFTGPPGGPFTVTAFACALNKAWWDGLDDSQRNGFASVSSYQCPSRRSGVSISEYDSVTAKAIPGPAGDYAAAITTSTGGSTEISAWFSSYSNSKNTSAWRIYTPAFTAPYDQVGTRINNWKSPVDFGSIVDGLSNTLLIGEKFVPQDKVGVQDWDTSYISSDTKAYYGYARYSYVTGKTTYFAKGPSNVETATNGRTQTALPSFGGTHTGIANFLVGDGSVHNISSTIKVVEEFDTNGNPLYASLLRALTDIQDGHVASVP